MIDTEYKKALKRNLNNRLSKIKVGLPNKVIFLYSKGKVTCYPKEKKWVVEPKGKKKVVRIRDSDQRNDVTKYKARFFLKLAILGVLKNSQ